MLILSVCVVPGAYGEAEILTLPRRSEFAGAKVRWHALQVRPPSTAAPVRPGGGPVLKAISEIGDIKSAVRVNL